MNGEFSIFLMRQLELFLVRSREIDKERKLILSGALIMPAVIAYP